MIDLLNNQAAAIQALTTLTTAGVSMSMITYGGFFEGTYADLRPTWGVARPWHRRKGSPGLTALGRHRLLEQHPVLVEDPHLPLRIAESLLNSLAENADIVWLRELASVNRTSN